MQHRLFTCLLLLSTMFVLPQFSYANPLLVGKTAAKLVKKAAKSQNPAMSSARKHISGLGLKGKSGIYQFKDSKMGKLYIGKSVDLQRRLKEHLRSGKLSPKDIGTLKHTPLSKRMIGGVEKFKIKQADHKSNGQLANIQGAPKSRVRQGTVRSLNALKHKIKK